MCLVNKFLLVEMLKNLLLLCRFPKFADLQQKTAIGLIVCVLPGKKNNSIVERRTQQKSIPGTPRIQRSHRATPQPSTPLMAQAYCRLHTKYADVPVTQASRQAGLTYPAHVFRTWQRPSQCHGLRLYSQEVHGDADSMAYLLILSPNYCSILVRLPHRTSCSRCRAPHVRLNTQLCDRHSMHAHTHTNTQTARHTQWFVLPQ